MMLSESGGGVANTNSGRATACALARTVARAFYPDECVVVLDRLVALYEARGADPYLADPTMASELGLAQRQMRKIMNYLREEGLVKSEELPCVDMQGKNTKAAHWCVCRWPCPCFPPPPLRTPRPHPPPLGTWTSTTSSWWCGGGTTL